MPLPSDEKVVALAQSLLDQFDAIFGQHPGFRPAHAKGVLLSGAFTPSKDAASLTRAPHFNRASTPVTVRFSDSTGLPSIPDSNPNANPRGIAIRFHLGERVHTDIIGHSTDGFPTRTGQEFLEFLRAVAVSPDPSAPNAPIKGFLESHPKALAFVQTPKPAPSSFVREAYFSVVAYQFTNKDGASCYGRYRIKPEAGVDHLSEDVVKGKDANYLFDEITAHIAKGRVNFDLNVQLANQGDVTDDATVHWPEGRTILKLGQISLTGVAPNSKQEQKAIIFDPIPRVDGIEPSADPLLELRAAVYLLSGRRRRSAPDEAYQATTP
jgi:catalase